ncbi:hypothetical protein ONZ45_g4268 [Pleurotus djamor]|nr:hypothetical protein ONZ45_g4268 [Pleurotus djamor]
MPSWPLVRYIVLGSSLLFSVVVLGLSANLITESNSDFRLPTLPETVGLVFSLFSMIGIATLLIVGFLRRGAITSMIVTEISVLSFFWILWLALAALATDWVNFAFSLGCQNYIPRHMAFCTSLTAVQGISFVVWFALMGYSMTILIMAIVAQTRGNSVWRLSMDEVNFSEKKGQALNKAAAPPPMQAGSYQYPPPNGLSLAFTVVMLGLSANQMSFEISNFLETFSISILGVTFSVVSFISLTTSLAVGLFRRNAITSMIITEIVGISVLWILWIALAALTTETVNFAFPLGCGAYLPLGMAYCNSLTAIQGISFVIWLLLMCYSMAVLIMAIVAQTRGNSVWRVSVNEVSFLERPGQGKQVATPASTPAMQMQTAPTYYASPSPYQQPPQNGQYAMSNMASPLPSAPMV